jgi:hypothetical protein
MIRVTAIVSLMALLILVLYLPSRYPAQRFFEQLRLEHEQSMNYWGEQAAWQMLDRALRLQGNAASASPIPSDRDAPSAPRFNAVAGEMSAINQRLFNNPYFRSVDALLVLACYRLSALLEWLPWLAVFVLAAMADALQVRVLKANEFVQHNPEMYALHATLAITVACSVVIACVLPWTWHPLLLPLAPLVVLTLLCLALGQYHRQG